MDKSKHLIHLVSHSQLHLYIGDGCIYYQIYTTEHQKKFSKDKEFPLYDYLQTEEKKEEGWRG